MFEISQLSIYRPIFMMQILCAEFLFAWNLPHRSKITIRIIIAAVVSILISILFPIISYSATYSSFMFFALFVVSSLMMTFCFKTKPKDIIFCAISGYTIQHISQEIYELANSIFDISDKVNFSFYGSESFKSEAIIENFILLAVFFFFYFLMYAVIYVFSYFIFSNQMKKFDIVNLNSGFMIVATAAIILLDIVFSSIVTFSIPVEMNRSAVILLHVYNILCCVLAIFILFEFPKRKQLETELMVSKSLQEKERMQYEASKDNIERLNIKYHDLKHQIRELRKSGNSSDGFLDELESMVDTYDMEYKTKNIALNVILSEKSAICRKNKIELSCILDGEALDFVKDNHIYSLLGNLLDNAIDAVSPLSEDKRSIGLVIKASGGVVLLNIYNRYEKSLAFREGLPITTKANPDMHGYGLKSVRNIVSIYNGELSVSAENGIFEVSIAIPQIKTYSKT